MNDNLLNYISGKYNSAIITTFDFDIDFFDSRVLPSLEINNVKNILLFVDSKEFDKSINNVISSYVGKKYNVIPIKMHASFHPKLVLLVDDDKAKLIVGSFNQTRNGYLINQEIYNIFEYNSDNVEYLSIIQSAIKFVKKLIEQNGVKDEIGNYLNNLYYMDFVAKNNGSVLINSLEESISSQIKKIINNKVVEIDIAVPFYDDELRALTQMKEVFACDNFRLFIQNGKSTFPISFNKNNNIVNNIFVFGRIKSNDSENFYHGKVIRFVTLNESYVLYGSSNCTLAALFKSCSESGNIECNVLSKGNKDDYNYFFEEFIRSETKEFTRFEEAGDTYVPQRYILNKIDDSGKYLSIQIKADTEPKTIKLGSEELEYRYVDGHILIDIEKIKVDTIFELIIVDKEESIIKCFYNDYSRIDDYRHSEKKQYSIPDYLLNKENIMLSDLIDLINCLPTDKAQIEENKKIEKAYKMKKSENESDDLTEEYEIDDAKLQEYAKKYNENIRIKKLASHISDNYFWALLNEKLRKDSQKKGNNGSSSNRTQGTELKDIDIEKYNDNQCKKLIVRLCEKLQYTDFVNSLDYSSYKDYVGISLSYLDKYQEEFQNKQLLSYDNVLNMKYELINKLLMKEYNSDLTSDEEKSVIIAVLLLVFEMIVNNNKKEKDNEKDKNIEPKYRHLLKLLTKYSDMKTYDEKIKQALILLNNKNIEFSEHNAKRIVDECIGYLNTNNIDKAIDEVIPGQKTINHYDNKIIAVVETDEINKGLELKNSPKVDKAIKIIKEYSVNVSNIHVFDLIITNRKVGTISRIEYEYNINSLKGKRKIYYSNGNKLDNEPEYNINYYR